MNQGRLDLLAHLDLADRPVRLEKWDHQGHLALQVHPGPEERGDRQVLQDQTASVDQTDLLAPQVHLDLPDLVVSLVLGEKLDLLVKVDLQDHQDLKEKADLLGPWDHLDLRDLEGKQGLLDLWDLQVLLALEGSLGHPALLEVKEKEVHPGPQVHQGPLALADREENLALLARQVTRVLLELPALVVSVARLVLRVLQDNQGHLGPPDLLVPEEKMGSVERGDLMEAQVHFIHYHLCACDISDNPYL